MLRSLRSLRMQLNRGPLARFSQKQLRKKVVNMNLRISRSSTVSSLISKHIFVVILLLAVLFLFGGNRVVQAGENTWTPLGVYGTTILDIAVAPNNNQVIYAATTSQNFIYKSTDGGDTWQSILNNATADWGTRILFDPLSPNTLYVIGLNTLYTTQNAGTTWETKNITVTVGGEGGTRIFSSAISPLDGVLYIGTGWGIFRSLDRGDTWESLNLPASSEIHAIAIAPSAPHIMYAGGLYAIYKSIGHKLSLFRVCQIEQSR